jgi:cytochrome P450
MDTPQPQSRPFLDLYGVAFQTNPHAALKAVREQHWCADTPLGLAVLRHTEVQTLLAHRSLRTPGADWLALQGITAGPLVETMRTFLLNTHGADHDRVRRLVTRAFTASAVAAFRPRLNQLAAELAAELAGRLATGPCDFMDAFAAPYAWRALCAFVGIPAAALDQVRAWNAEIGLLFGMSVATHAPRIEAALDGLHTFIDGLVAEERRAPGDTVLSALVAAGEDGELLTPAELRAMVITLMSAGSGTVTQQLGHALLTMLAQPALWQQLATAPATTPQIVEEIMRYAPAVVLGVPRIAIEDLELNGLAIPAGSCLLPITGSANHDEQVFANAESVDPTRAPHQHLSFGGGMHRCIGAALARAELAEALPLLATAIAGVQLAEPPEWCAPTEAVYGPTRLMLSYPPADAGAAPPA